MKMVTLKCHFDLSFNISKGEVHESSGEVGDRDEPIRKIADY
jgi:hypothetical protein